MHVLLPYHLDTLDLKQPNVEIILRLGASQITSCTETRTDLHEPFAPVAFHVQSGGSHNARRHAEPLCQLTDERTVEVY